MRFSKSKKISQAGAFTLVELLVVMAIIIVLMGLLIPAIVSPKGANDVTKATYDVAGILETARSYAKAKNTYVWVGFFEEDASMASTSPATAGTGRVVISVAAAKDGLQGFHPDESASATNQLDPTRLRQVGKPVKIENVHLASFPDAENADTGSGDTFETRPRVGLPPYPDHEARIGENDPPTATKFPLQYPVGGTTTAPTAQYTFTKTIQFNPRGESVVNSSSSPRPVVEIGLQPSRGSTVDTTAKNVAAIQITGIASNVKIYRR